ncbi:MAG: bifunctional phosphoribosylaminoimidazolecarboxamide formyltransferase/IMP cyclohydrolase PurH [Chloroflexi bacterium]|nr:MAG: bifunctional phosphoribosylaminoimidazolecarboxamide formyltransferase/IMP cyclohydrolase PurH [Chloroflexota bacterium]
MPVALMSVSDKTGLVSFARSLADAGWEFVASGGTANTLRQAGLDVKDVADLTQAPEMLGGRVKTLHPVVHAGILARPTDEDRAELARLGIREIDMVVCNLYPFQQTVANPDVSLNEAIEQIDIGGVTLLRAAAKNYARVTVVCDPADYEAVAAAITEKGFVPLAERANLARKAFAHTAQYDAAITNYLSGQSAARLPDLLTPVLVKIQDMRYGENPHQRAALYGLENTDGPLGGRLLQGKPLSYNNVLDLDAAWQAAQAFEAPTVVIVKHLSPCGIASAATLAEAFPPALASDPVSAFGGVIAVNREFSADIATALGDLFVEAIAAPAFSDEAREILSSRKNCRLVEIPSADLPAVELRTVTGGVLVQERDAGDPPDVRWEVVTERYPTEEEITALKFAWTACQFVKSNAIVFAVGTATVGIGTGQPSRVDAVKLAAGKAGEQAKGAVMASDAFFPFPDGIEAAAEAGVTAVVQPGGSVRDEQVIAAANRLGMAMVFTGVRHFRH